MKKLTTFFFIAFFSLALAATGQAENNVTIETSGETFCSEQCHPVGWIRMTFDEVTTLRRGPSWGDPWGHDGDYLFFDICGNQAFFCDDQHENPMDFLISNANEVPILTPGLDAGTYGPVTLSGDPLTGSGTGISFQIVSDGGCLIFLLVVGEEGASVTVPAGGSLSITLFDGQAHSEYMWKKADEHEEDYSVPVTAGENTLNLDTRYVEGEDGVQIDLNPQSKDGNLIFHGDTVLATIVKALAHPGEPQVVFDTVTLDGSQSQGSFGNPIASHQWHLEHWKDPAHNRDATGESPNIGGLAPGFYNVTLTVTDENGCTGQTHSILAAAGPCRGGARVPYMLLLNE